MPAIFKSTYPQVYKKSDIVPSRTTTEYFLYLVGQRYCIHTKPTSQGRIHLQFIDEILPFQPMRQWVLSVPFPLRFLFASNPKAMTGVLGIVYRAISTHLTQKARLKKSVTQTGAVTLIQRFGSALNLNTHFHMLFLDGVYSSNGHPKWFRQVKAPRRALLPDSKR